MRIKPTKALLNNKFAPITFTWGFVESPFDRFSEAFVRWQSQIDKEFDLYTHYRKNRAPLTASLLELEPLTTPQNRYLLTNTRSQWCAIFSNGLRVNDLFSPVSYLPTILHCRGLEIACVPDRSRFSRKDEIPIYGTVKFALYGSKQTDWLNRIRSISIWNDVNGWEFVAEGEIQPYEQTENYRKRSIADRFTTEMLEDYCAVLGIDLFNDDFYGEENLIAQIHGKQSLDKSMSIAEARSCLHI